jgi:hypothetical protein
MVHRRGRKRAGESTAVTDSPHIAQAAAHGVAPSNKARRAEGERRRGMDRRSRTLRSLLAGSLNPRRRGPRRTRDQSVVATDWHEPQWLAVAVLILLLSVADALLTLALLQHRGVLEANPVMAALMRWAPDSFAAVKFGLTAAGVVLLTVLARMRAFGRLPVSALLCGVLVAYVALVSYEVWLLRSLASA